jgi:hypothetical protein
MSVPAWKQRNTQGGIFGGGFMRFSEVSIARQMIVRQCQRIGHGKILRLAVRAGDPLIDGRTEAFADVKLDLDETPRPELALDDFDLSAEVVRFFRKLDALREGEVELVEIRAGVPRRVVLKVSA